MEYLLKLRCDAEQVQRGVAEGLKEEYGIEAEVEQIGVLESTDASKLVWLVATQDFSCNGMVVSMTADMVAIGYDDDGSLGGEYRVYGRVERYCPQCGVTPEIGRHCQECGEAIRNCL